eukprot:5208849-Pleurochrysis_carterae.AAC.1
MFTIRVLHFTCALNSCTLHTANCLHATWCVRAELALALLRKTGTHNLTVALLCIQTIFPVKESGCSLHCCSNVSCVVNAL